MKPSEDIDTRVYFEDDGFVDPSLCAPGNEHTGRWTQAEHELFLEALHKFGRVIQ